jgi:hypothetical protein
MGIVARRTKQYPPPASGQHDAVLVDVIDQGEKDTPWGSAHKVQIVFELGPSAGARTDGRRHTVSAWYTLSLAPSSNLTRDLSDWGLLGEDRDTLDLEDLIGTPARVVLVHAEGRDGRTVARIKCILPADPKTKLIARGDYQRRGEGATASQPQSARTGTNNGDEIPW